LIGNFEVLFPMPGLQGKEPASRRFHDFGNVWGAARRSSGDIRVGAGSP